MSDDQGDNTSKRGFASMPRDKVQEIASKGGKARAERARQNREDREQGGSGGANLDDELNGQKLDNAGDIDEEDMPDDDNS
jgi:hypothetical protein